ncbi:hypothetical protein [Clostridium botulinum]|uniref:hypothetical protein n=1 Tax=Clostridium botulinum TaxID=1491 RepID=UPI0019683955|nr:hypothetical protein [Clostridium botulinum]
MAINKNLYEKLEKYDQEISYLAKLLLEELEKEKKSKTKVEEMILEEIKEIVWEERQ